MNIIDTNKYKEFIFDQIDEYKLINVNSTMLGAIIFKSKKEPLTSLALWKDNIHQAKNTFSKLSPEKQYELSRHTIIELPLVYKERISLKDILLLLDSSGSGYDILGFVSCVKQAFPVYPELPEHVAASNNYIKCMLRSALKVYFNDDIFIVNNKCYATANILPKLVNDSSTYWRYIYNTDAVTTDIIDISSDFWKLNIVERKENDWCTFILHARRNVLKDFDLHNNCVYTNIHSSSTIELNRNKINNDVPHLITVFDIKNTLDTIKSKLCENETIEILNALIV